MRLTEILKEDYTEDLDSDLMNLLVNAKSVGKNEISTNDLVRHLRAMGYSSVDLNSIQPLLQNSPVVMSANDGKVILKSQTPANPGMTTADKASEK